MIFDRSVPLIIVFSLFFPTLFMTGCIEENGSEDTEITPIDDPSLPPRGYYLGTLPIPAEGQEVEDSYRFFSEYGDFCPVWGRPSPFYQLPEDLSGDWGETYLDDYIRANDMFPMIHLSFIGEDMSLSSPSDLDDASLSDTGWREAYKDAALKCVKISKPMYLSLGNEVNRWYEEYGTTGKNGFQHYVSLYEETYEAVKDISPETKVFCVFAREIVSENREADFSFLSMFDHDKLDLMMITSYPHSVQGINRPSDIPSDYYSSIANKTPDKPFGFSEISWPSDEVFGGESAQADFLPMVSKNLTVDRGVNLHMLAWAWLHDLNDLDDTGMISRDGAEKQIFDAWKSLKIGTE